LLQKQRPCVYTL